MTENVPGSLTDRCQTVLIHADLLLYAFQTKYTFLTLP